MSNKVHTGKRQNLSYILNGKRTQIINLPGGCKSNEDDINDNVKENKRLMTMTSISKGKKIYNDLFSNIACLDNSLKRKENFRETRYKRNRKNIDSDNYYIFTPYISGKRMDIIKRTNEESLNYNRFSQGIKKGYKNVSRGNIF